MDEHRSAAAAELPGRAERKVNAAMSARAKSE
jgi:hypothetical protein